MACTRDPTRKAGLHADRKAGLQGGPLRGTPREPRASTRKAGAHAAASIRKLSWCGAGVSNVYRKGKIAIVQSEGKRVDLGGMRPTSFSEKALAQENYGTGNGG